MQVSMEKSRFCQVSLEYLGFKLNQTGYKPLPSQVDAILQIQLPKNIKQVPRFLGHNQLHPASYHRMSGNLRANHSAHSKERQVRLGGGIGSCDAETQSENCGSNHATIPKSESSF